MSMYSAVIQNPVIKKKGSKKKINERRKELCLKRLHKRSG